MVFKFYLMILVGCVLVSSLFSPSEAREPGKRQVISRKIQLSLPQLPLNRIDAISTLEQNLVPSEKKVYTQRDRRPDFPKWADH